MSRAFAKLLLLHGWSGSSAYWQPLERALGEEIECRALRIPGHEGGPSLASLGIRDPKGLARYLAAEVERELERSKLPVYLVGYSMGGRIALLLTDYVASTTFAGVVLFSAGLGEVDPQARELRLQSDRAAAAALLADPPGFWQKWYAQPLFRRLSPDALDERIKSKKIHKIEDLSESLEYLSPALHGPLGERLARLQHLLYFAGELDEKYCGIAQKVREILPSGRVEILAGAGHDVPGDKPEESGRAMLAWMRKMQNE